MLGRFRLYVLASDLSYSTIIDRMAFMTTQAADQLEIINHIPPGEGFFCPELNEAVREVA